VVYAFFSIELLATLSPEEQDMSAVSTRLQILQFSAQPFGVPESWKDQRSILSSLQHFAAVVLLYHYAGYD